MGAAVHQLPRGVAPEGLGRPLVAVDADRAHGRRLAVVSTLPPMRLSMQTECGGISATVAWNEPLVACDPKYSTGRSSPPEGNP